jgi:hypothetical protein
MKSQSNEALNSMATQTTYDAGAASALFPILYAAVLIWYAFETSGPRIPQWEGVGYLVAVALLASLSHLVAFLALQAFLIRGWRLRAVVPLQLLCVGGSLLLLHSLQEQLRPAVFAVLAGPALITTAVYVLAAVIARKRESSDSPSS